MGYGEIRTVHAILPDGSMIVRYSRSKRWFHEDVHGNRIKRFRKVSDAANMVAQGGDHFSGRPEGSYLDKYVAAYTGETNYVEPVQRYTAGGLRRAQQRAQAQYRRDLAAWKKTSAGANAMLAYPVEDDDKSNAAQIRRQYQEWWYGRPKEPKILRRAS